MARLDNDTPCDFLTYLEWRLDKDEDATTKLLGEWLSTYEPQRKSREQMAPPTPHDNLTAGAALLSCTGANSL